MSVCSDLNVYIMYEYYIIVYNVCNVFCAVLLFCVGFVWYNLIPESTSSLRSRQIYVYYTYVIYSY